jgi:hypothetical protein
MKHTTSTVQSLGALTLAAVASVSTAFAGTAPKEAPMHKESTALFEKLNATLESGYDSAYYFRGLWFSNNNVWTGLTLNFPATEQLNFSLGSVYTSSLQTNVPPHVNGGATGGRLKYAELDLIAAASYDAGFAKFGLVYTYYNFFDTFSGSYDGVGSTGSFGNNDPDSRVKSAQDLGITVSKSFGPVNTTIGYWYDFKINGQYMEASADCPVKVTSWLSVVPAIATGYGMDYYSYAQATNIPRASGGLTDRTGTSSGWTHVRAALSTPIQLTDSASFVPYAAINFSGRSRDVLNAAVEGRNDFYFGTKLSVSF